MKGKIYIIRSHLTDDVYYGSTTQKYLSSRIAQHKRDYKNKTNYITSFEIIKYEDSYIELVEEINFETKDELRAREGHYIRNNNCVNKQIPNRTLKEWYDDNKEEKKEYQKEYRDKNKEYYKNYKVIHKEKLAEQQKEYRDDNKDSKREYDKEYRDKNRDKKKEYQKEYYKRIKNAEA